MDQKEYRTLILASLLHDIGKLLNKPEGGPHSEIGEAFLRRPECARGLQSDKFAQDVDFELLCYLVRWHAPYTGAPAAPEAYETLRKRLSNADKLSSGERNWETLPRSAWKGSADRALDAIFNPLYLGRPLNATRPKYRPVPLHPEAAFPQTDIEPLTAMDYAATLKGFEQGFVHALENAQGWQELEAWVYALLERYTWAVPSDARRDPPQIALFDHARTSCAIAAALHIRAQAEDAPRQSTFLLIQGDISGVQDYIYTVANIGPGGVAKRLRARSFFITALTETLAHRLRDTLVPDCPLPIAAQVISGGAQFVILAPDLPAVRDNVERIRREVNRWLWDEFQGDLAVILEFLPITQADLDIEDGNICAAFEKLGKKVKAAKQHRLSDLLQADSAWQPDAFKWEAEPYPHGDCPSCQRLPARAAEGASVDERLCPRCYRDRVLSEQIVKADYIGYYAGAAPDASPAATLTLFDGDAARYVMVAEKWEALPPGWYQLDGFGHKTPTPESPALVRHFANHVPRFQDSVALSRYCTAGRACVYGRYTDDDTCGILVHPEGGRIEHFPILQTFGCISAAAAEWEDGGLGSQFLGVLRADVDNLGLLFAQGMGARRSLSRVAMLSRMMDLFFSGWIHHTLEHPPAGKRYDHIYTVYAGGDDLCLVGPWDVVIDFSHYLAEKFAEYVGWNPNVTLSAAITVTKPKYPIATAAWQAGEWLDHRAKALGRNRLHLFGVTVRWRALPEYDKTLSAEMIAEYGDPLSPELREVLDNLEKRTPLTWDALWPWAELLDDELRRWRLDKARGVRYPVSTGFAHRLLQYAEMARYWEQEQRISAEDMLYLARLAYDLGRNVVKSNAVDEETKRQLSRLTHLANRRVMAGLRLPVTYALYRNRERSREA